MIYIPIILFVTGFLIMIPRQKSAVVVAGTLILLATAVSSLLAFDVLFSVSLSSNHTINNFITLLSPLVVCDKLSAFFILIINFTIISGYLYSTDYMKPRMQEKPPAWSKLHYLSLFWLHVSMIMVLLLRNGFWFLIAWEIMTLSSFILVIYEFDKKGTIAAGITYLVQMHVGMFFLLGAFIVSSRGFNTLSLDNLDIFFLNNSNWPVFLLFFTGFGLKAGFFLLHSWLPDAHPAAPSHVSGIMSGVMIKIGIYGILRVALHLKNDFEIIASGMIIISAFTGLFGVMMAILQHDVKKLLAYHSIENIGIIGLGIGLGIYGRATGNEFMSVAGYAGALLHTLNHSLFKSLLFYSSGSVINNLHTRNIEKMGGLMKYMPLTAWAFLIGAAAISGLPPLNGFISEFLVYSSVFSGMWKPEFYHLIILIVAMLALVMIGGLALLCFTKVFSVIFLGSPRTHYEKRPVEAGKMMLLASAMPVLLIVFIGFFPSMIIKPLISVTYSVFLPDRIIPGDFLARPMSFISLTALLLVSATLVVFVLRRLALRKKLTVTRPVWGCGYEAVDSRQQYTASSFVQEYAALTRPFIKTGHTNIRYRNEDLFPEKREFHTHSEDLIKSMFILKPADLIVRLMRRFAVFQTGKLQHYVLFALLFLLLIFILTYLKLI